MPVEYQPKPLYSPAHLQDIRGNSLFHGHTHTHIHTDLQLILMMIMTIIMRTNISGDMSCDRNT